MKWISVLLLSVTLWSCQGQTAENAESNLLSVAEAEKMLEKNNVVFIDVRTKSEVKKGKIDGARHHNFFDDNFTEQVKSLPKNVTYVVYCARGSRSAKAISLMQQLGFTKLYDLKGGYIEWQNQH